MAVGSRHVRDAAALKALAHPLRVALLGTLVTEGPMTASQAAARVDDTPSNCSWHLRKLAEHGFVREARSGTGRNRPWQAVSEGLSWGDDTDAEQADRAAELAADALTDVLVERELQRLRAARASRDREPTEWREATGLMHTQLWLTAEEAARLRASLSALLRTHIERAGSAELRPDGARLVSLVGWLVPSGPQ